VTLLTPLGHTLLALNDGRDLLTEIVPGWWVGQKLYEIVDALTDFIQKTLQEEKLRFVG